MHCYPVSLRSLLTAQQVLSPRGHDLILPARKLNKEFFIIRSLFDYQVLLLYIHIILYHMAFVTYFKINTDWYNENDMLTWWSIFGLSASWENVWVMRNKSSMPSPRAKNGRIFIHTTHYILSIYKHVFSPDGSTNLYEIMSWGPS